MKLVFYHKGVFSSLYDRINNPCVKDNEVTFDNGGAVQGLENTVLLADTDPIPDSFEEASLINKMSQFKVPETVKEVDLINALQTRLDVLEQIVIKLNGGSVK